jgi:hypothetical protein
MMAAGRRGIWFMALVVARDMARRFGFHFYNVEMASAMDFAQDLDPLDGANGEKVYNGGRARRPRRPAQRQNGVVYDTMSGI